MVDREAVAGDPSCAAAGCAPSYRAGGRAVECTGLENRRTRKGLVGSNPTLPATWERPPPPEHRRSTVCKEARGRPLPAHSQPTRSRVRVPVAVAVVAL